MEILGIRVDRYDMASALHKLEEKIAAPMGEETALVVTINPEGVMLAREDETFRTAVEQAYMVTADGAGILWAASQMGDPMKERVTGIDLLDHTAKLAAEKGWRVYFLGAKPGFAEKAAENLAAKYPGFAVVGSDNGYFRDREADAIARVKAAEADILFAALGMPYQEKWLYQHRKELGCKVAIGVGGSFDVLSGAVKRAPRVIQKIRMEWLWRLLSDPKRWRRYLAIPRYMKAVKQDIKTKK